MRIQNTPFGSNPFKRGVAIITSALFLFTGLFSYAPTAFAKPNNLKVLGGNPSGLHRLDRDREIRIPPELGLIDESFRGNSGKTILFIQDAHDSLEAQENIAKIINHLVTNDGVKTVFEEGYEGPVPTDKYFGFIKDPKIKEKVAYFLMDHLRFGGAEYAHINRTKDFILVGADSLKLHKENVDQYRFALRPGLEVGGRLRLHAASVGLGPSGVLPSVGGLDLDGATRHAAPRTGLWRGPGMRHPSGGRCR